MPHKPLVVVPALNEEASLPTVLSELADAVPHLPVLVVSDGSTDATVSVAARLGVDVLDLPINLGVGGAMRAGFRFAVEQGYDAVIQVDADGQHNPAEIPRLFDIARDRDLVIGARFAGVGNYRARGLRRWAMAALSAIMSRVVGTRLDDTTSGFKLVGPAALAVFARDYPAEYLGDTIEALVVAKRAGLRIGQVPVGMRDRMGGDASHGPARSALFLFRAVLALVIALTRPVGSVR